MCLALLIPITPRRKSSMSNSFKIIIIKIIIIKVNIIKVYSIKTPIITINVTLSESSLTKTIPSLENTTSSSFSRILFVINQSGANVNAGRKTSKVLSLYFLSYIY